MVSPRANIREITNIVKKKKKSVFLVQQVRSLGDTTVS